MKAVKTWNSSCVRSRRRQGTEKTFEMSETNKHIRAGIIGGAGYTGGEMIRILINHPWVDIAFVHSKSNAGKYLYEVHEDLAGETDRKFDEKWHADIDVLFLCVGHGEAKKFLEEHASALHNIRLIDLSQDYRLHKDGHRPTILPELASQIG